MRVHIASDHAGFELKAFLVANLQQAGHEVVDHGAAVNDPDDDYPVYCLPCAEATVAEQTLGIVLGGSGNGEQIAANKVRGCRAVLVTSPELARLGREHNNANVISLGARFVEPEQAWQWVQIFLSTPFSEEPRHARRIALLDAYEAQRG